MLSLLSRLFSGRRPAPPKPDLSAFSSMCERFVARVAEWKLVPCADTPSRGHVAILVTPWIQSAVPLFALEEAFALRAEGCEVSILLDDKVFPFNSNDRTPEEARILREFMGSIDVFPVCDVRALTPARDLGADPVTVQKLLWENFIWLWKKEEGTQAYLDKHPQFQKEAEVHCRKIITALRSLKPDWILLPGGVFGVSGLYAESCRAAGFDFTTYDSGPDLLAVCHRDVAGFHSDVAVTVRELDRTLPAEFLRDLGEQGRVALLDKMSGNDPLKVQVNPDKRSDQADCDLLLCLNRRADTAAMMRLRLFDSVRDWIESVMRWVIARQAGRLVIRQHPCERWERFRLHDDYARWIREIDPEEKYVTFVPADSEVNTYSLVREAKVILPFTSRTGIEATILGKPIVQSTHSFYANMGFGWFAKSRDEYFSLIEKAMEGGCQVTPEHQMRAGLVNFVFANCEWLSTPCTPRPEDFENWVKLPPGELWSSEVLQDFKASLITRTPVPLQRFRRLYARPGTARVQIPG